MTDFRMANISKQEAYDLLRDWIKLVARHTNPDQNISELLGWLWKLKPPVIDSETGLVPCGCGGKAHIINSSGYSRRLYVECDRCAIMLGVEATGDGALQGIYRYDGQIIKDWNRAMGKLEVEG